MAKIMIVKKDGTKTPFFWVDRDTDRSNLTVYRKCADGGIKRMTGVHYNAKTNQFHKH